ncbi:hypothetical protein ACFQMM_22410 [Saliphagus sp. GCM10025308]
MLPGTSSRSLWDNTVKPHPKYDRYRSQRSSFPRVRVARKDDAIREFVLHHEGALLDLHLNGVPVDGDPSEVLVDTIETFLDADQIDEERWFELIKLVEERLSNVTEVSSHELAERMLLYQGFLPPSQIADTSSSSTPEIEHSSDARDPEWYREHWRAILSTHRVTSQAGLRLIKDKQDLMEELRDEGPATTALYAKLERDVERAWDHYSSTLVDAIKKGLTADIVLEVSESRDESGSTLEMQARNIRLDLEETVDVKIYMPYRDVRVNERQVSRPTISNSADEVLVSLAGLISPQVSESVDDDVDLLYDLIVLYGETRADDDRSLVYFDDLIEFCLTLPGVPTLFRGTKQEAARDFVER